MKTRSNRTYNGEKAAWEEQRRLRKQDKSPSQEEPKLLHAATARKFLAELEVLAQGTRDRRFQEAIVAIHENGLLGEDSDWVRSWVNPMIRDIDESWLEELASHVTRLIKEGHSQRVACAIIANEARIDGNSFEAAWRRVVRLWEEHEKAKFDNSLRGNVQRLTETG
jgi:hypothetical protein